MPFDIDIQGMDALLQALKNEPDITAAILERASAIALLGLIPDLADYPPPPPKSTYRRTGTLGRTWTAALPSFQTIESGFESSIGNATPYASDVQGTDMQSPVHRNRWKTDTDVIHNHATEINHIFEVAAQDMADAIDGAASKPG
jgi:hypothetical protein